MKKTLFNLSLLAMFIPLLTGCCRIGDKSASLSVIYAVAAVLSLLLLIGYCSLVKKKDAWFLLLFSSVLVVNIGYFALGVSRTLEEALLANRIAYLGSVFLPLSMQMIIINVTKLRYRRWLPCVLCGISVLVFLVAASPGYLDIYYKEVSLQVVNGVSVLDKVYGPWHSLYLFYLLGYFVAMVSTIIYAFVKNALGSIAHSVILASAVFVNIGVWLIEQLVKIDFEILSISYIISELFLLGVHLIMAENERRNAAVPVLPEQPEAEEPKKEEPRVEPMPESDGIDTTRIEIFLNGIETLTPTERSIYEAYIKRTTTKEIMTSLNIKENTLKFHNKNIYGKLGVSSRKELMEIYKQLKARE